MKPYIEFIGTLQKIVGSGWLRLSDEYRCEHFDPPLPGLRVLGSGGRATEVVTAAVSWSL